MTNTRKALRVGLPAFVLAAFAAIVLAFAPSAAAATTISINPGNVPTTAADFPNQECDHLPGDTSSPTQDGWVFVLPGNSGSFVSVSATFTDVAGDTQTREGTVVSGFDGKFAYVQTPVGWTLTGATAVINGSAPQDQFNLTHACPATEGDHTSPPSSESPGSSTSPTTGPSGSVNPSGTVLPTSTTTTPGALPTTGSPLTGILITGVALAAAGTAALVLMRRRRATNEDIDLD